MLLLKNAGVSAKLATSSGLAILLIAGMMANQHVTSRSVLEAATTVDDEQMILDGIVSAELALGEMRFAANGIQQANSVAAVRTWLDQIKASSRRAWEGLEKPIQVAKKPAVLNEIRLKLRAYEGEVAKAGAARLADSASGAVLQASAGETGAASSLVGEAKAAIDQSVTNAHRFTDGAKAELRTAMDRADRIGLLAGLAVVIVLIASAMFLTRSVGRPIRTMTLAMRRLADGDTDSTVPYVDQRDEIGEMAKAVETFKKAAIDRVRLESETVASQQKHEAERARQRTFEQSNVENLRAFVMAVEAGFTALADGNLTVRMNEAVAPEFEPVRAKFNESVGKLEDAIGSVVGAVGAIRTGLSQITAASNDLSQRTEQQAARLEETVAALGEITGAVNQTASRAGNAQMSASSAQNKAAKGGEIVSRAVASMAEIEQSSGKISKIIGVIDEIAFQTNLLALNAGVEAARAGETGRGFAVVAQEVRGLAQRSAEAAKEIKDLIATSSAQVAQGVESVRASGKSLEEIVVQVGDMNSLVADIARSAQEQSVSLKEVSSAADQMDKVTQQNAAMVEETTAAARNLANETEDLAILVERFTTRTGSVTSRAPARSAAKTRPAAATSRAVPQMRATGRGGAAAKPAPAAESWEEF